MSASTIVKTITASTNAVTSRWKPESTADATMSPTAFPASETRSLTRKRITLG